MQAKPGENISYLAKEVLKESKKLVEIEAELFQQQMIDKLQEAAVRAAPLVLGVLASASAVLFLGFALVYGLAAATGMPLWSSYLSVGIVFGAAVPLLFKSWKHRIEPPAMVECLKENLRCLKTPTH